MWVIVRDVAIPETTGSYVATACCTTRCRTDRILRLLVHTSTDIGSRWARIEQAVGVDPATGWILTNETKD